MQNLFSNLPIHILTLVLLGSAFISGCEVNPLSSENQNAAAESNKSLEISSPILAENLRPKIESKELILLLPQHIRNEICSQPLQMQMKDDNVDPATSCTTSCPTIEELNSCEEYVRLEKMLQEELQEELRVVRTRGYFIPRMKWNPNNLQSQTTTG